MIKCLKIIIIELFKLFRISLATCNFFNQFKISRKEYKRMKQIAKSLQKRRASCDE